MPSGSDLQGSVEKAREAFRRINVDDADDRWQRPAATQDQPPAAPAAPTPRGDDVSPLHPFFQGLLEALPEPGSEWPRAKREQWLETARNIFALLYVDPAETPAPQARAEPVDFTAYAESRFGQQTA